MDACSGYQEYKKRRKMEALTFLAIALMLEDKWFSFTLSKDGNTVTMKDMTSGATKDINITADNISAMLYDVLRQGKEWLF